MKLTDEERRRRWLMWARVSIKSEDFARYHRRSNDESMVAAIKALTRASVRVKEKP